MSQVALQKLTMKIIKTPKEMASLVRGLREKNKKIGFVPTMGYFHEGHLSLIRQAKKDNDIVVVSIFVNPTQFAPGEDYNTYPRDFKTDSKLAKPAGCDIIFNPSVRSMYLKSSLTYVRVSGLSKVMCGSTRPNHFKGVTTICTKLFNIIAPDIAYFGQKDYQQAIIIKQLVSDLNINVRIKIMPIVREKNGLAMSSRNKYLSQRQRESASTIYKSLKYANALIKSGAKNSSNVKAAIKKMLLKEKDILIDYIKIVNPDSLTNKNKIDSKVLIALAVKIGRTRLIDNIIV